MHFLNPHHPHHHHLLRKEIHYLQSLVEARVGGVFGPVFRPSFPSLLPTLCYAEFPEWKSLVVVFEGEKNHKGGGLNCVFKNFSFLRSEKLFPDSESEIVQSLSAADKCKRTEKERTQAIIQVPSTNQK